MVHVKAMHPRKRSMGSETGKRANTHSSEAGRRVCKADDPPAAGRAQLLSVSRCKWASRDSKTLPLPVLVLGLAKRAALDGVREREPQPRGAGGEQTGRR